jgi:hypothetical protein
MSVQDAKGILTGGDDSATQYFPAHYLDAAHRALPADREADDFEGSAGRAVRQPRRAGCEFRAMKQEDATLDSYVTRKALDGLYLVIADQERAIRKDPVGAATRYGEQGVRDAREVVTRSQLVRVRVPAPRLRITCRNPDE